MSPILRKSALLVLFLLFFAAGCGDCTGSSGYIDLSETDTDDFFDTQDISDTQDGQNGDNQSSQSDVDDRDTDPLPPQCEAELICGQNCCEAGELCLVGNCIIPGGDCQHSIQCAQGEFCEPVLNKCLPEAAAECTYVPEFDAFDPVVEQAWQAGPETPMPDHKQVMMTPSVVDITGDGIPEIVFSTFSGSAYNANSVLRAINGRTYEPVFDLIDPAARVSGSSSVAIGDIDSDGQNEIVAVKTGGLGLIAFDDQTTDWAIKWDTDVVNAGNPQYSSFSMSWDSPYLADLDGDGTVEVVAANRVFDGATGEQLCVNTELSGTPRNSIVVDLTGNGNLDIVAANGAFEFINNGDGTYECPTLWRYEGGVSGYPAAADFGTFVGDNHDFENYDGLPEIAIVTGTASHTVRLHNGQTGELIWSARINNAGHPHFAESTCDANGSAGPPTIADFNGDGRPNVATAGACFYAVFDHLGQLTWKHPSQDFSSRVTGSSVFDFQGDGRAEAVYADECFLRVYDGTGNGDGTTTELFKIANTSGTTRELPVIVDVDGDFHAEIVLIGNDYSGVGNNCRRDWPGFEELGGESQGIRVIKDRENRWVRTRPVWNQHAYSVTNVCDGLDDSLCPGTVNRPGAIPSGRINNWDIEYLNNFRQNAQGEGLFLAADLVISSLISECQNDEILIEVTIANEGSQSVIEGVDVALFAMVDGEETLVTVLQTTQLLPPGGRETLTYLWEGAPFELGADQTLEVFARANDDGQGQRQYRECNADNNERRVVNSCACQVDSDCKGSHHYCATNGRCYPYQN